MEEALKTLDAGETFSAQQVRLLQSKAWLFITYINELIIENAGHGKHEISISTTHNPILNYDETMIIAGPVLRVFRNRGFNATLDAQSSIDINWKP